LNRGDRTSNSTDLIRGDVGEDAWDPTVPELMTNVAEYGFDGWFEDWAEDVRYVEYSKAAKPIGSGHTPNVSIKAFSRDLYLDGLTRNIPLDEGVDILRKFEVPCSPVLTVKRSPTIPRCGPVTTVRKGASYGTA
jgi:hypothetical protein